MRTVDTVAWTESLGVHPGFLERAMNEKLRRMQDAEEELRGLFNVMKDAPHDEMVLSLRSANRSLTQAVECMQACIRLVRRAT
jgi:hypothetical protein